MSSDFSITPFSGLMGSTYQAKGKGGISDSAIDSLIENGWKIGNPNDFGLDTNDFLQLIVQQFQNQTIDETASTTDMINQMVQLAVIQSLTAVNNSVATMVDASTLSYAASLVGKEVTVGEYDEDGNLTQIVGIVSGTGTYQGQPVIFVKDKQYFLSEIMAIGTIPEGLLDVQITLPDKTAPTVDQAPGEGSVGKYTYDMEGIAFDRKGTVLVKLGGKEYEVDVASDTSKEDFVDALESAYNKDKLTDPTGGELSFINNEDGTFTLEASAPGAWEEVTLGDISIRNKPKDEGGDGDGEGSGDGGDAGGEDGGTEGA